jgi:hypothetical protein
VVTSEELKKTLSSKENILAGRAIETLRTGAPLEDLQKIIEAGASDKHFYRDPLHPRSRYRVDYVLDECYRPSFGVTKKNTTVTASGVVQKTATLGHHPAPSGYAQHFAYLLDRGFTPGSNGYRGDLFPAIMKACFYSDAGERSTAMELAKILVARGKVDVQKFAENSYEWTGSEEKLLRVIGLGAIPSPAMLDTALNYCLCAKNQDDPESGRADVIRVLLDSGVAPSKKLGNVGSSKDQREFLSTTGLLKRLENLEPHDHPLPPRSPISAPRSPSNHHSAIR